MKSEKPDYSLGSVERIFGLLDLVAETPNLPLGKLADRAALTKTMVLRYLRVLEEHRYVVRDPASKGYSLGPRLLELGAVAQQQLALPKVAESSMVALRDRVQETVHLGILADHQVVHIHALPSKHLLTMAAAVGERTGAHLSSLGKCLLAWAPPGVLQAVIDHIGLFPQAKRTITTREALEADLELVRERGYALDDEESTSGGRCVGAPIRRADGTVIAALSVSAPISRLTKRQIVPVAEEVVAAAEEISRRYGWRPDQPTTPPVAEGNPA